MSIALAESAVDAKSLYESIFSHGFQEGVCRQARDYLDLSLSQVHNLNPEPPPKFDDLENWMLRQTDEVIARYGDYLQRRKNGGAREYFHSRSHALYFLRAVAPTKLVDGSWLYSLTERWADPRFSGLLRTYLEELGDGDPTKNHALLYRRLLESLGLEQAIDFASEFYTQGAIQLALGMHGESFMPEVVGFNLGYEQLPLHLLITAYELNEIGIDPYYFQLHITVDNSSTGHARRAIDAIREVMPLHGDVHGFQERVHRGFLLNNLGKGTLDTISEFDIEQEAISVLKRKSVSGKGAHSDYCKVEGRTVNDWLSCPSKIPDFVNALKRAGWIAIGQPLSKSRFWKLLIGDRADMFGVFNAYELQVICDWIRGPLSKDGLSYHSAVKSESLGQCEPPLINYRALSRNARRVENPSPHPLESPKFMSLVKLPIAERMSVLVDQISPLQHWTPHGLSATRAFSKELLAA